MNLGQWAPTIAQVFVQMTKGNINPPLNVTAQQNGVVVFSISLNATGEVTDLHLADFPNVTFPLTAGVKAANGAFQITIM